MHGASMELTFISATLLLIFVFDPFGNIPLFISVLNRVDSSRRTRVILRECLIAFLVLMVFLFFCRLFLALLHISETSLGIAGGVILFLDSSADLSRSRVHRRVDVGVDRRDCRVDLGTRLWEAHHRLAGPARRDGIRAPHGTSTDCDCHRNAARWH